MLVAGGFCYGRLSDESRVARESQNSPDSCACLRRLLSIRSGSRDRRKLEELYSQKTSHRAIFSWQTQFAGAALRILRSSHEGSRDRRKLEELLDLSTFWGMCCRRSWKETNPTRRDFCRPGGAAHASLTNVCVLARAEGFFDAANRLFHIPRRVGQHDPRSLRHPLHHGLLGRNHG